MSTSRMRNPRGEGSRLRAEVLASAIDLLETAGTTEAISLRAVARGAGITAPSIYAHFPDRDALVAEVVVDCFARLSEVLHEATGSVGDPVERLHAGCRGYLRFAAEHPARYRAIFGGTGDLGHPGQGGLDRESFFAEPGTDTFKVLVDCIADCAAAGRSESTDPFHDAAALWAALHGYSSLRTALPHFPWPEEDEFVTALVDRLGRIVPTGKRKAARRSRS